jgi:hypothetical protein
VNTVVRSGTATPSGIACAALTYLRACRSDSACSTRNARTASAAERSANNSTARLTRTAYSSANARLENPRSKPTPKQLEHPLIAHPPLDLSEQGARVDFVKVILAAGARPPVQRENPGVGLARTDAGAAWCDRARVKVWRGDLWDR